MNSFYEDKVKDLKTKVNSMIELHSLNLIEDDEFYTSLKKYCDQLDQLNMRNVVVDETVLQYDDEDKGELDRVIKNLQSQLVEAKADNIRSFQKLMAETNSNIIPEQEEHLNNQVDYAKDCIAPIKQIHNQLLEK